jgi:hypothetical protein
MSLKNNATFTPEGLKKVGTVQKDPRILKGCEISIMALIVALASLQDADLYYISTRGFTLRSNPWLPSLTPPG